MKQMYITAIAFLSVSTAFAGGISKNSSWEELQKSPYLEIEMPVVFMGHAVSYDFICQEGSMFRTKKMVDIVETHHGREHDTTTVVGQEYLTTPIHYTRTVSDCKYIGQNRTVCEDKVVTGTYPTTVNVKVYKVFSSKEHDHKNFLFMKPFTVPQCD